MQIAILSDIHGNLPAFEAVLRDLDEAGGAHMYWSLGDITGYGPYPNECIERLRELPHLSLPGNHDYGVIGRASLEDFNSDARRACLWSRERLSPENLDYLLELPEIRRLAQDSEHGYANAGDGESAQITLVHASPRDYIWEYLLDVQQAALSFSVLDTPYCFIGHSHVPLIFAEVGVGDTDEQSKAPSRYVVGMVHPEAGDTIVLEDERLIMNPGSVGQPRDGDPRAAYALYSTEQRSIEFRRVQYDIARTQQAIIDAGLPFRLALRLSHGL